MYYRVKRYNSRYVNMYVLDKDPVLNDLLSRTRIDCAGYGAKSFTNPRPIQQQEITCVSMNGIKRNSHIISE